MDTVIGLIKLIFICFTLLCALGVVLLALPQSKLREALKPVFAVLLAIGCAIYAISPIDLLPEAVLGPLGLFDDAAAVVVGLIAAHAATNSKRANSELK